MLLTIRGLLLLGKSCNNFDLISIWQDLVVSGHTFHEYSSCRTDIARSFVFSLLLAVGLNLHCLFTVLVELIFDFVEVVKQNGLQVFNVLSIFWLS